MRLDTRGYQIAAWVGAGLLGICTAIAAGLGRWWGVAELGGLLIMSVVFLLFRKRLPSLFSLLFVTAALLNGAGWVFNLWDRVPYYDKFAHFYTPFTVALALGLLAYHSVRVHFREHGMLFAVSVAALGITVGALWEIFEWSVGIHQPSYAIISDLIADTVGSVLAGLCAAYVVQHAPPSELGGRPPR